MENEAHTGPLSALITLTRQLTQIILEENRMLEIRRPHQAAQLHEEKGRLAVAYEREIGAIRQNGGLAAINDAASLRQLKQETKKFQDVLDSHRRILVRLRTISESMIKAIGDEISKQNNPVQNYGGNAVMTRRTNLPPTSLALNHVI